MDRALVARLKDGDTAAFEEFVYENEKKIYNIAYHYTGNEHDASDITQDVFIRIYKNIQNFHEKSSLSTWVYQIAVNTSIDHLRKKKRQNEISLTQNDENEDSQWDIPDSGYEPEQNYERTELCETIRQCIQKLPDDQKQVIILRDINGFSYAEISKILSLEEGTIKSRIFRARNKLKVILKKAGTFSGSQSSNIRKGDV